MSRYGYDYSLTPGRPKGWRSVFRNVLMVGAIAAISAVSGVVVALDLLGSGSAVADHPTLVIRQAQPVTLRVAGAVAPTPSQPAATANAGAAVETSQVTATTLATPTVQPSTTATPQAGPTTNGGSTVSAATVDDPNTLQVPERELTFSKGYARRRAVQAAATTGSGTNTEVARVEEQHHVVRAVKAKSKTTVARQNGDQRHVLDARDERQQTFAFGDARASRRPPPQRQGGLFSSNPFGGFFRGTF